jgi:L-iditol 2-dehydrogenase
MKAIRIVAPGHPELVDTAEPVPRPGECLVRVSAVGLCATDRRLTAGAPLPGLVPGHEIAGRLADGTRVGIHPDVGCGACSQCRAGYENRCPRRCSIGVDRDGGMAEWVAVPEAHTVPIGEVDPAVAPLLEPLACCLHAIERLALRSDDRALVVGAGTMGLLTLLALKQCGVPVVVVQRSEERRRLAEHLGADVVVGFEDDPAAALGTAPSVAIVTAPAGEAVRRAAQAVEVGGRLHVFAGLGTDSCLDGNAVHYRHLTVIGSTGSRLTDYQRARDLVAAGAIDLSRLPVTRVALSELPAHLSAGVKAAGKVIADLERSAS